MANEGKLHPLRTSRRGIDFPTLITLLIDRTPGNTQTRPLGFTAPLLSILIRSETTTVTTERCKIYRELHARLTNLLVDRVPWGTRNA